MLCQSNIDFFNENGYLFYPEVFSPENVDLLNRELGSGNLRNHRATVFENDGSPRALHGVHHDSSLFSKLVTHAFLLGPVKCLLESDVYVHQFKINLKVAFKGEAWPWHQDFIFWHKEDGLPEPKLINVALFLSDISSFNGPLFFVPGSHKRGCISHQVASNSESEDWRAGFVSNLKYQVSHDRVSQLINQHGMVEAVGPAGTVMLFHANMVHGSGSNMSPFDRRMLIVSYNSVENAPAPSQMKRSKDVAGRDFSPLMPMTDKEVLF